MDNYPFDFSDDMILPDDFNPDNKEYRLDGENPAPSVPTTEMTTENDVPAPQEAAPTTEQDAAPVVEPQTIRVKFNHEERDLTLDEAQALAQKGLNYDKLQERLNSYEAVRAKSEQLARNLGYESEDQMLEAAQQNFINKQVRELVNAGNTEAMARFLVEQRMAKAAEAEAARPYQPQEQPTPEPQSQPAPEQPARVSALSPERKAELDEFVRAYPGVTKLPPEVIEANQKGVRLLVAYERYQNQSAINELAVLKQNQAAAARAPVSGVTGRTASPEPPEDVFLKGFNADNAW